MSQYFISISNFFKSRRRGIMHIHWKINLFRHVNVIIRYSNIEFFQEWESILKAYPLENWFVQHLSYSEKIITHAYASTVFFYAQLNSLLFHINSLNLTYSIRNFIKYSLNVLASLVLFITPSCVIFHIICLKYFLG